MSHLTYLVNECILFDIVVKHSLFLYFLIGMNISQLKIKTKIFLCKIRLLGEICLGLIYIWLHLIFCRYSNASFLSYEQSQITIQNSTFKGLIHK